MRSLAALCTLAFALALVGFGCSTSASNNSAPPCCQASLDAGGTECSCTFTDNAAGMSCTVTSNGSSCSYTCTSSDAGTWTRTGTPVLSCHKDGG